MTASSTGGVEDCRVPVDDVTCRSTSSPQPAHLWPAAVAPVLPARAPGRIPKLPPPGRGLHHQLPWRRRGPCHGCGRLLWLPGRHHGWQAERPRRSSCACPRGPAALLDAAHDVGGGLHDPPEASSRSRSSGTILRPSSSRFRRAVPRTGSTDLLATLQSAADGSTGGRLRRPPRRVALHRLRHPATLVVAVPKGRPMLRGSW